MRSTVPDKASKMINKHATEGKSMRSYYCATIILGDNGISNWMTYLDSSSLAICFIKIYSHNDLRIDVARVVQANMLWNSTAAT